MKAGPCVCALVDAGGLLNDDGADRKEEPLELTSSVQEQRCGFCWRVMEKLRLRVTRKK